MPELSSRRLPLDGVRVIELGQLLAGPFTGALLAYFGSAKAVRNAALADLEAVDGISKAMAKKIHDWFQK